MPAPKQDGIRAGQRQDIAHDAHLFPFLVQIEAVQIVVFSKTLSPPSYLADKFPLDIKGKQPFGVLYKIAVFLPHCADDIPQQYPVGGFQQKIGDTIHQIIYICLPHFVAFGHSDKLPFRIQGCGLLTSHHADKGESQKDYSHVHHLYLSFSI